MSDSQSNAKLQGRVAQILNAREIVINIGASHGVTRGMKFAILAATPMKIADPTTHEVLDVIDREKVRVEAAEVRERITICRTFRTRTIPGKSGEGILSDYVRRAVEMQRMYEYEPPKIVVETLRVEDSQFPPPLDPEESYVKINDRVVLIEESSESPAG